MDIDWISQKTHTKKSDVQSIRLRRVSYECSSQRIVRVLFAVYPTSALRRVSCECSSPCIQRVFINTCSFVHDLTSLAVCLKKHDYLCVDVESNGDFVAHDRWGSDCAVARPFATPESWVYCSSPPQHHRCASLPQRRQTPGGGGNHNHQWRESSCCPEQTALTRSCYATGG